MGLRLKTGQEGHHQEWSLWLNLHGLMIQAILSYGYRPLCIATGVGQCAEMIMLANPGGRGSEGAPPEVSTVAPCPRSLHYLSQLLVHFLIYTSYKHRNICRYSPFPLPVIRSAILLSISAWYVQIISYISGYPDFYQAFQFITTPNPPI